MYIGIRCTVSCGRRFVLFVLFVLMWIDVDVDVDVNNKHVDCIGK